MQQGPIGIFDSGVGGTSIWREINRLLPSENSIYLADSKNAPYGEKSASEIIQLSAKNADLLIEKGCKLIVVACNTATTNAIDYLRENYPLPFIGIEPAIKPAALNSKSKTIGVLATKGTLTSELFSKTAKDHAANIKVVEQEGKGLVSLIESGAINDKATEDILKSYLKPMIAADIDHLVLGCTHYPYLIPILRKLLPEQVRIIDCGEAVARQTKKVLQENNLLNTSAAAVKHQFYSNNNPEILSYFLKDLETAIEVEYLDF
ncbi:glutamate racemase [Muriicola sp. Z0-33]|uniref:glutamate racemase n=1 Tax=Muriicola sp. Z0-33 TaxID=2816957 RepID=UPI00223856F3|nr:glutamate racemase [Muriicola sp. Z0-33]MCW5516129.1 glutamate racemase [Muriicola sp. Z0-33]